MTPTGVNTETLAPAPLILVIENDPTQRTLSSSGLRSAGYKAADAKKEAIEEKIGGRRHLIFVC
ncbi:MAG: response regulator [Polaromonas sp.]|nr:response regulator [Polaromonas sp.]